MQVSDPRLGKHGSYAYTTCTQCVSIPPLVYYYIQLEGTRRSAYLRLVPDPDLHPN